MKTKSGLTFAILMTLSYAGSYAGFGGIMSAHADDIHWFPSVYDSRDRDEDENHSFEYRYDGSRSRYDQSSQGYEAHRHWSHGDHDRGDRGWHKGTYQRDGYKQDVVYLQSNRAARYQTIYYSPGYPRAIASEYRVGEYLPRHVRCEEPPRSVVAVLPPVSRGTRYVQVDRDVYLVSEATKQILDAVVLLSGVR